MALPDESPHALSALRLRSPSPAGTEVTVTWQSVAGVAYFLERSTTLSAAPPFTALATNLSGQAGTTTFTDADAARLAPLFYRVGVTNWETSVLPQSCERTETALNAR